MRNLLMVCLFLLPLLFGWGRSCVWEVEKEGKKLFIGGTCHCLNKEDYPLPAPFDKAYKAAEMLVFECDMDSMQSADFQKKSEKMQRYADGTTVKDHLSPKVYGQLEAYCNSNNVVLARFGNFKPPTVMLVLTFIEFQKAGISTAYGVDGHFHRLGKKEGKRMGGLESAESQMELIATMADGIEDEFVLNSLGDMKGAGEKFKEIISAWKKGDSGKLVSLLQDEMVTEFPHLYKKIVVNRNKSWIPEIERLVKTPEREFILVGAAHLVGKDSVLSMLKKRGYTVRFLEEK